MPQNKVSPEPLASESAEKIGPSAYGKPGAPVGARIGNVERLILYRAFVFVVTGSGKGRGLTAPNRER